MNTTVRRALGLGMALVLLAATGHPAWADSRKEKNDECLECHAEMEGETISFETGPDLDVGIDAEAWNKSVHGRELACTDCHRGISEHPHPELKAKTAREYRRGQLDSCRRCHYAYYTRVLDGMHYRQLAQGNEKAPTCIDCHSVHSLSAVAKPRTAINKRCARCHEGVFEAYSQSVHGRALAEENNADVPVCTDCHGAHDIDDPRRTSFHVSSYEICARCHADAERMAPYGLSTNVVHSYLDDFHGMSNRLYGMGAGTPDKPIATCTDCHGVHRIESFDKRGTKEEVRERVLVACSRCHKDATPAFADAWLSHYEPTFARAPLVAGIVWIYRFLIPFIMVGLVLHILLHLWRVRARRRQGGQHHA